MARPPSLLLLCTLVANTVARQDTRVPAFKKTYLDKDNFVLTWSLRMEGATSEQADNLTHCYKKCEFPSCLAFRFNETTGQCTKVTCSGISLNPSENEPLTFLRALDGVKGTLMDDPLEKAKTILASSCLGQEMYYDSERSGNMSMEITRYNDGTNGYKLYTKYDKPSEVTLKNSESKPLGLMIAVSGFNNNGRAVAEMDAYRNATFLCPEPDCFQLLCTRDLTTYRAALGDIKGDCSDAGAFYVMYGVVSHNGCCGARVRVKEYVSALDGQRFYGTDDDIVPDNFEESGLEYYVWPKPYNTSIYH